MSNSNIKQMTLALLLAVGAMTTVHADTKGPLIAPLPKYQQECASCHMAFPPGLLPASSWQRLMSTLNQHYGTDASLDDASVREIGGWLKANAGSYQRASEEPPQDRITKSAWFLREHNEREVPPAVWKRASVGSAANCAACHSKAAQGSFSEREIKIPR